MTDTRAGLPEAFLVRLRRIIPPAEWEAVVATFAGTRPITFRVNTLKATVPEVTRELNGQGFRLEAVPWYTDAFIVREGRLSALQETVAYGEGRLYVQSLSSMLPALLLDPQPGERVLDLTAAPGGKTTQMACQMRGTGELTANDNNRVRFYKLQANIRRQGATMVKLMRRHGESMGRMYVGAFDRILVDAPCSTEGRFELGKPKTYQYWRPGKIQEMARKQKRLLASAMTMLRPGGVAVYATCTFAPEENEAVVNWVLARSRGIVVLEPIAIPVPNWRPGVTAIGDRRLDPTLTRTRRVIPTSTMEGFFVARLRKQSRLDGGAS